MIDDENFTPWTPEGAARLRATAVDVAAAITAHAEAVAAGDGDVTGVLAANEALLPVLLAYADTQFDQCGNGFPFGTLHQYLEPDEDAEGPDDEESVPAGGVSVLQRHDYEVTDGATVMAAGRQAYLAVWPEDGETAAAADVTHLGRALYQIAHADGWNGLEQVEGLRATGGAVVVVASDELLGQDPDEWPEELFAVDGELLYQQSDVYPG